jgi:hypothetical protein
VNNELERIWKVAVVAYEIISPKLAGGPQEKQNQPQTI